MQGRVRWLLSVLVVGVIVIPPLGLYRYTYDHSKRLRVVVPGRVYRSGQMLEAGFAEAVATYGIRTVINVQDDFPDPNIAGSWVLGHSIRESDLCQKLGVRFVYFAPNLVPRTTFPRQRPEGIDRFLEILDDPTNYPLLIHCKAGLHRTGCLVAVARMEYQGWTSRQALRELLANGFGRTAGTEANDYIRQYVLGYQPHLRQPIETRAQR